MKQHFHNHKAFYQSFLINILFLLCALIFCAPKYEASDDYIVDALLSGAYTGSYNPYMLFSNIILGKFLVFFYTIIPYGSIYFYYLIFSGFLGFWGVCYIIQKKHPNPTGILLSIIVVSFLSDDIYISINFTKTAALSLVSGGLLIIYSFLQNFSIKKKILLIIFGSIEFILGSFLRFNCVPLVLSNLFLYVIILYIQKNNLKSLIRLTIFSIVLTGLVYAFDLANSRYRLNGPEGTAFIQNHKINAGIENAPYSDYFFQKEIFDSLSYSENDFNALSLWNFVDHSVFPLENRKIIGDYRRSSWKEYANTPSFCVSHLLTLLRKNAIYPSLWAIVVLLILILLYKPSHLPYAFSIALFELVLLYYCIYKGRSNYRSEYSIYLCAVILIAMVIPTQLHIKRHLCLSLITIFLCAKIPLYFPDNSLKTLSDSEYYELVDRTMFRGGEISFLRYKTDIYQRRSVDALLERIENDKEHYYVFEFLPYIQILYYNYKPWERVRSNYLVDNYTYLSGVTYENAFGDYTFTKNGIDAQNPNASLIDNPNIIFVTLDPTVETQYLKEHYCETIQENIIDTYPYAYLIQYTSK